MTNQTADPLADLRAILEGGTPSGHWRYDDQMGSIENTEDGHFAISTYFEIDADGRKAVASVTLAPLGLAVVKAVLRAMKPHPYNPEGRPGECATCIEVGYGVPSHDPIHSEALRLFMAAIPEVTQ